MERFKNFYGGQAIWIIGKGPSLQYLTKKDIGEGPVITISESIIKIEELGLSNPVFSMQKDGGIRKKIPAHLSAAGLKPDCDYTPNCGDRCGMMYRPKRGATLLVHQHESLYCFPDYSPRYVFDWVKLGLSHNEFSLVLAVKIGILMGCKRFYFVSFDSFISDCIETYIPNVGIVGTIPGYKDQIKILKPYLVGLDYKWITPV